MLKGLARAVVYLLLILPLTVITVLITKHIQFAYDLRRSLLEPDVSGSVRVADIQQIMAANELSTRSFFLMFICFLLILCGLLITLKSTENAFIETKEMKVKYSLRTAYPGIVMAVFGCLLLAYSVYKSSQSQLAGTKQVVNLKKSVSDKESLAHANAADVVFQADLDTTHTAPDVLTNFKEGSFEKPVLPSVSSTIHAPTDNFFRDTLITSEDIKWAEQLARSTIRFGYYPTKADNERYNFILKQAHKSIKGLSLNSDLQWAFRLLQKTQAGYEPTGAELRRYEDVVGNLAAPARDNENKSAGNY